MKWYFYTVSALVAILAVGLWSMKAGIPTAFLVLVSIVFFILGLIAPAEEGPGE